MGRLWRKIEVAKEGKYLVKRRDGTVPEWPWFVLGAKDPAAPSALRAYAVAAAAIGYDPAYVADIRELAEEFDRYQASYGSGDPDAPPHRRDDPDTVAQMGYPITPPPAPTPHRPPPAGDRGGS